MKFYGPLLIAFFGFSSCATYPPSTGYRSAQNIENYGYSIKDFEHGHYAAIYRGNQRTNSGFAFAYTMLAAYEYCIKKMLTGVVSQPKDLSSNQTYTSVQSFTSTYYNKDGTATQVPQVYSYPVTETYPNFIASFECREKFNIFLHDAKFESISRELIHEISKDFQGGLLVKSVKDEDIGKPFFVNDVLIKVESARVENSSQVTDALEKLTVPSARVEIIRGKKIVKVSAKLQDLTSEVKHLQNEIIKTLCKAVPKDEEMNSLGEKRSVETPRLCDLTEEVQQIKALKK